MRIIDPLQRLRAFNIASQCVIIFTFIACANKYRNDKTEFGE
ncbi:MAG: hypothetical protein ACI9OU_002377 [Candidatus Promineifilaceae bacterium]|jgi:hypothetical protein